MCEISVVVPLYNKEKHIKRCLDSIINQTYRDFEIIVVNDGSTDQSEQEVKKYNDPRIRLINKNNGGEASARNRGIREAKANIVAFLDADDQWLPCFLERIIFLKNKYPMAKVFTTGVYHNNGERFTYLNYYKMFPKKWDGIINPKDIFQIGPPFNASSIAVNKGVFTQFGFFDETLKIGTDTDMWFRLLLLVPFAHSHEYLAEVFLDAENRSNFESHPTDTSSLLKNAMGAALRLGSQPSTALLRIIDQELNFSKFSYIACWVPRPDRWEQVKPLMKKHQLFNAIIQSRKISFIDKVNCLLRINYWFMISFFGLGKTH